MAMEAVVGLGFPPPVTPLAVCTLLIERTLLIGAEKPPNEVDISFPESPIKKIALTAERRGANFFP